MPIRGTLPWEGSSSAILLDDLEHEDLHTPRTVSHGRITWTRTSLRNFWNFLLAVQRAESLGPLSLSFHAAMPTTANASTADEPQSDCSLTGGNRYAASESCLSKSKSSLPPSNTSLPMVDHIKIYHDNGCAMYIRNVIDAWKCQITPETNGTADRGGSNKEGPSKVENVRVLKGAVLTLVDETSNGVLLS